MQDQAQKLRKLRQGGKIPSFAESAPKPSRQRIIAITSGKGGVGKTNVAVNLAISLTRFGHRVLLLDADFGLANIDLLLGLTPKYNVYHVFSDKKRIEDVLLTGPSGIRILPSSTGGKKLEEVSADKKGDLIRQIRNMGDVADLVFIDTGAGISNNIIDFLVLADEILLVTTPEPTSIMDTYGILKILAQKRDKTLARILVNMAEDSYDAEHVMKTIKLVSRQFFNITIEESGFVLYDRNVSRSVRQQQPFLLLYPSSRASRSMNVVATRFANYDVDFITEGGALSFFRKVASFFT